MEIVKLFIFIYLIILAHLVSTQTNKNKLLKFSDLDYYAKNKPPPALAKSESRRLTFTSPDEISYASYLSKYFDLRQDCDFDLNTYSNKSTSRSIYCPSTSDYLVCYPSFPSDTTFYANCPYKHGLFILYPNKYIYRYCQPNGKWASTNYLSCIRNVITGKYNNNVDSIGCYVKNRTVKTESTTSIQKYFDCDVKNNAISGAAVLVVGLLLCYFAMFACLLLIYFYIT